MSFSLLHCRLEEVSCFAYDILFLSPKYPLCRHSYPHFRDESQDKQEACQLHMKLELEFMLIWLHISHTCLYHVIWQLRETLSHLTALSLKGPRICNVKVSWSSLAVTDLPNRQRPHSLCAPERRFPILPTTLFHDPHNWHFSFFLGCQFLAHWHLKKYISVFCDCY